MRYKLALNRRAALVLLTSGVLIASGGISFVRAAAPPAVNPQNGSVGLQGTISTPPPTTAATISTPTNGQSFNTLPVTASGICTSGLLVKFFKNNVFAGSTQCDNGSFKLQMDLFTGTNDLIARVYDALDQAGPDSNTVTVTFNDPQFAANTSRVSLTSNYAKRGANPGESLDWPIAISGGTGPYAISVDWGDGKATDLISQAFPGTFTPKHSYDNPGVYNIIIKATDKNGGVAFLQLVGVGNGPLTQTGTNSTTTNGKNSNTSAVITKVVWWPALAMLPFIGITFWLGKRHELYTIRKSLERRGM